MIKFNTLENIEIGETTELVGSEELNEIKKNYDRSIPNLIVSYNNKHNQNYSSNDNDLFFGIPICATLNNTNNNILKININKSHSINLKNGIVKNKGLKLIISEDIDIVYPYNCKQKFVAYLMCKLGQITGGKLLFSKLIFKKINNYNNVINVHFYIKIKRIQNTKFTFKKKIYGLTKYGIYSEEKTPENKNYSNAESSIIYRIRPLKYNNTKKCFYKTCSGYSFMHPKHKSTLRSHVYSILNLQIKNNIPSACLLIGAHGVTSIIDGVSNDNHININTCFHKSILYNIYDITKYYTKYIIHKFNTMDIFKFYQILSKRRFNAIIPNTKNVYFIEFVKLFDNNKVYLKKFIIRIYLKFNTTKNIIITNGLINQNKKIYNYTNKFSSNYETIQYNNQDIENYVTPNKKTCQKTIDFYNPHSDTISIQDNINIYYTKTLTNMKIPKKIINIIIDYLKECSINIPKSVVDIKNKDLPLYITSTVGIEKVPLLQYLIEEINTKIIPSHIQILINIIYFYNYDINLLFSAIMYYDNFKYNSMYAKYLYHKTNYKYTIYYNICFTYTRGDQKTIMSHLKMTLYLRYLIINKIDPPCKITKNNLILLGLSIDDPFLYRTLKKINYLN